MPENELRLLALDGGGVRGLSSLMILEALMKQINEDAPPKPCEYFDMIGGTSTGGLIAIMLGRLEMTVTDCIDAYLSLSDEVFVKKRLALSFSTKVQGRFDSEKLARKVKEVVVGQGLTEDALLKSDPTAKCKVFVCVTSKDSPTNTVCLTSYKTPRGNSDLLDETMIWQACRATSAASSFFEPIRIGKYGETFIDGATGANNPINQMWDQAHLLWGPLDGKLQRLVSIGTGMPSTQPFGNYLKSIMKTLKTMTTETERTAEDFERQRPQLARNKQYYRFNVPKGLEDIGLEESKKRDQIAGATRGYLQSEFIRNRVLEFAGKTSDWNTSTESPYKIDFSLRGVPRVRSFVDRPAELKELAQNLLPPALPDHQQQRQRVQVMYGLGGIGKTQLAFEFARRHQKQFDSVFWLDAQSKDSVDRSIAESARKIPKGQISEPSRKWDPKSDANIEDVVNEVLSWLEKSGNTKWLLIFDNVDREYGVDPQAFDMSRYLPGAGQGSVLITTRLLKLTQIGSSMNLKRLQKKQSKDLFDLWFESNQDSTELLELLDGLPLAIAQAGAYLKQDRIDISTYVESYKKEMEALMNSSDSPLLDYRWSVWTTWIISYQAIREKDNHTANLLLLWSFLDNKALWFDLLAASYSDNKLNSSMLTEWLGELGSKKLSFNKAMGQLCSYSLVEKVGDLEVDGFATHPVVHQWAYHYQGKRFQERLNKLAIVIVANADPGRSTRETSAAQNRLLPHAQACSRLEEQSQAPFESSNITSGLSSGSTSEGQEAVMHQVAILFMEQRKQREEQEAVIRAMHQVAILFTEQGKQHNSEQMYQRLIQESESLYGHVHDSILRAKNSLGILYMEQGRLYDAQRILTWTLARYIETQRLSHPPAMNVVSNLALVYQRKKALIRAMLMCTQALGWLEQNLGKLHASTLRTANILGNVYADAKMYGKAEGLYRDVLWRQELTLGRDNLQTTQTVYNLGVVLAEQDKFAEAEQFLSWSLEAYRDLGQSAKSSTASTLRALGLMYAKKNDITQATHFLELAKQELVEMNGLNHPLVEEVTRYLAKIKDLPNGIV